MTDWLISFFFFFHVKVEEVKEKKSRYQTYQKVALALTLTFLVLALSALSLTFLWSPTVGKVRRQTLKSHSDGKVFISGTASILWLTDPSSWYWFRVGNENVYCTLFFVSVVAFESIIVLLQKKKWFSGLNNNFIIMKNNNFTFKHRTVWMFFVEKISEKKIK